MTLYLYLKALHIIFIVTWFAGLFYFPRLLIYNTEANEKEQVVREALQSQFRVMMTRLWYGITWPSAILTLILGLSVMFKGGWADILFQPAARWLLIKLIFVFFLYLYHFSLHRIYKQQMRGDFRYSSQQLRLWNEVATVFLFAIVMLVVVKQNMSVVWALAGLIVFVTLLMSAVKIYKIIRTKKN